GPPTRARHLALASVVRTSETRNVVFGSIVRQRSRRKRCNYLGTIANLQHLIGRHLADLAAMQFPLLENSLDIALAARARYDEHAFLGFGEHDFVGGHELGASWHERDIDAHADAALGGNLTRRAGQSSGAEVLERF